MTNVTIDMTHSPVSSLRKTPNTISLSPNPRDSNSAATKKQKLVDILLGMYSPTAVQRQKAVSAYFTSE